MALPLCLLISVGGRCAQRPGPSPTLGSLGPSHEQRHKSRVSLRSPPCAHDVSGTPLGEVHDRHLGVTNAGRPFNTIEMEGNSHLEEAFGCFP